MVDFSTAFFAYYLALTVIVIALVLSYINNTNLFSRNVRQLITDYAYSDLISFFPFFFFDFDIVFFRFRQRCPACDPACARQWAPCDTLY